MTAFLCILLLSAVALLAVRLSRTEARLAEARRRADEAIAERDGVLAELALNRERLAEARQAAGRAQAAAAEREVRPRASPVINRSFGESRCEAVSRMVDDALRDLRP